MTDDRAALERALAADPADRPTHAAYADMLAEAGDPRGDYVRLQLALEDRTQPIETLRAMEQEAFALRQAHEAAWLGPLADHVNPAAGLDRRDVNVEVLEANVQVTYRRGWVHELRVRHLTIPVIEAIRACPLVRLTDALEVEAGNLTHRVIEVLPSLRRLTLLAGDWSPQTEDAGWLHAVRTRHGFREILRNPSPRLAYLTIHTPDFDDAAVGDLVNSGVLETLTDLDLSDCAITDDGAASLANCPAVHRLDTLELAGNHISPVGIDLLAAVGVAVSQRQRLGPPGADDADGDSDEAGVEW
jgi:uncharacterized protein (TIGR02996 family)